MGGVGKASADVGSAENLIFVAVFCNLHRCGCGGNDSKPPALGTLYIDPNKSCPQICWELPCLRKMVLFRSSASKPAGERLSVVAQALKLRRRLRCPAAAKYEAFGLAGTIVHAAHECRGPGDGLHAATAHNGQEGWSPSSSSSATRSRSSIGSTWKPTSLTIGSFLATINQLRSRLASPNCVPMPK